MRSEAGEPVTELAVTGWHFLAVRDGVPVLRDGTPAPPVGVWLHHGGDVKICHAGLHASRRAIDALLYAPGNWGCRVTCADVVEEDGDKLVCRWRRIDVMRNVADVLHAFARLCALSVAHLWDCPTVMTRFLETGDEALQSDAWAAASAAARDAARAAASDAASAAAWAAARAAARAAASAAQNEHLETLLKAAMELR